jgi:hypothetical protein
MRKKTDILNLFQRGMYREIVEVWRSSSNNQAQSVLHGTLIVGALCFLGKQWEAEEFPKDNTNPFGRNFFLGLTLTRESKYSEARKLFTLNSKNFQKSNDDLSRFFTFQGEGFFSFFTGETTKLLEAAEEAYRAALRIKFVWGQMMALDLVAHAYFYQGQVQESLDTFQTVIDLANSIQAESLATSYQVSQLCYQSQISCAPLETIAQLKNLQKVLKAQDTYSKNTLQLEVLRQYIHAGLFDEVKSLFSQISPGIYAAKNRRQIASLLHRYAYFLFLQGADIEAVTMVRSARMNLIEDVDQLHILRSYGLEKELLMRARPFQKELASKIDKALSKKIEKVTSFIPKRINSRKKGSLGFIISRGQDPLGDLLDRVKKNPFQVTKEMVQKGLWGLIGTANGWDPQSKIFILDVHNSHALIFHDGECYLSAKKIKGIPRKILELLREEVLVTKEQIIQRIWGYKYEALRHDSLVHTTIHQLRLQVGEKTELFSLKPDGYSLQMDILDFKENMKYSGRVYQRLPQAAVSTGFHLPSNFSHFNVRQIHLLRITDKGEDIHVRAYCKRYHVSHMTAFRDLKILTDEKFFQRVGKGRSTCYIRL